MKIFSCPFCGKRGILECVSETDGTWVVRCVDCGAYGPCFDEASAWSKEEAVEDWNVRLGDSCMKRKRILLAMILILASCCIPTIAVRLMMVGPAWILGNLGFLASAYLILLVMSITGVLLLLSCNDRIKGDEEDYEMSEW